MESPLQSDLLPEGLLHELLFNRKGDNESHLSILTVVKRSSLHFK